MLPKSTHIQQSSASGVAVMASVLYASKFVCQPSPPISRPTKQLAEIVFTIRGSDDGCHTTSPDYTPGSDTYTKPFEVDPQDSDPEESSEEDPSDKDPMEDVEPLSALAIPAPPTRSPPTIYAPIVQPGQEIPLRRPYRLCWCNID
ncbi:hypothetical protein Tco_0286036 [Tanacetum coccineum]